MDNEEPKTLKQIDDTKYRVPITELKLGDNYKEVRRESIDKLKRSLLDDDQLLPILTDARIEKDGVIIGGYHQYFAIKELVEEGRWLHGDKVWVEPRQPKDDKHAKILSLKHNTQYDIATTERLAEYGADLIDSEYMLSDIPVITDYQVLTLIDVMDRVGPEVEVTEDEAPEVDESVEPVSKLGNVYQLGRHRLMCGDSTKIEDVEKLMNGQKADMVFTDPPYGLGGYGGRNDMDLQGDDGDVKKFYECIPYEVGEVYVWGNWKNLKRDLPYDPRDVIIWRKNNFGLGTGYRGQYEMCFYFGSFNGSDTDIWDVAKDVSYVHPTQKPVELSARAITNSNPKNVLDLFGGSGSTLIACEQLNRTCYMMEIDPKYCDVIRKRYAKFIGKEDVWENVSPIVGQM